MIRRLILVVIAVTALGWAQGKRPFTFEDMMALKRVGEPVPSPDGKWVAFSAVEVNLQQNNKTPHIWVVPLGHSSEPTALAPGTPVDHPSANEAKQISNDPAGEDRPRWSPDGKKLAFISSKDGGAQVWVADFDPAAVALGVPQKLTNISTEAAGEMWSPDGKYILFTSEVYPDCNSSPGSPSRADVARDGVADDACNKQRDQQKKQSQVKATLFHGLFYRHWATYTGDKRTHIFIQEVAPSLSLPGKPAPSAAEGGPRAGAVPRDLTPGDHDAPPFSLGGQDMYAFSPDSQEVAFTSNIDEVPAISTNNDIFIVPVTGGKPRKISVSPGSDSTPLYSPDGKYIAWRMQETPGYESDRFQLVLYDRKSGQIRSLTKDFDRWVGSFVWAPDAKKLYFSFEDRGFSPVDVIGIEGGDGQPVLSGHNDDLTVTPDGKTLLLTRMSVTAPNEVWSANLTSRAKPYCDGQCFTSVDTKQVTNLNGNVLSQVSMQPLESFWFTGAANHKVQGFLVKPPNFDPSKKYPVKFLIHGGPEGAWGDEWSYRWNPELMAAGGYVVLMINFTGSTGYGQKFTQAIQGDWGGRPYQDLMLGLDYVEKTYPFIDQHRECALGASYGGYMANWILGHTTRFQCIVSHDGMFNTTSAYGATEELWFPEWEFKGTPWTNRALYDRWSPHLFAANFKTPTLVVHGQLDYRLDVSQGFDLFTNLQRLKVPSRMLYFPDEGHWVLKPQNSQLWYKTVGEWVDQWIGSKK